MISIHIEIGTRLGGECYINSQSFGMIGFLSVHSYSLDRPQAIFPARFADGMHPKLLIGSSVKQLFPKHWLRLEPLSLLIVLENPPGIRLCP